MQNLSPIDLIGDLFKGDPLDGLNAVLVFISKSSAEELDAAGEAVGTLIGNYVRDSETGIDDTLVGGFGMPLGNGFLRGVDKGVKARGDAKTASAFGQSGRVARS